MKRLHLLLLLFCLSLSLSGQRTSDYGIFGGVTSYLGDINPTRLLYSPGPAGGMFFRYNLNPRQALKASILLGRISGNDLDFNNDFQKARKAFFSGTVGEASGQFEFNFLPYTTEGKPWTFTPYFAAGLGIALVNTKAFAYVPVIPFTFGLKMNIYKNLGLEAEYGFRKTFYDNFDGLKDLISSSDYSWLHNNDWYSFAGIAFTWKLFNRFAGCRAYDDVNTRTKR
jgi:hypothetical protein